MTRCRKPIAAALALLVPLLAYPSIGAAQEAPPVPLRFGSHATFQRMVLDWPQSVTYFLERSDRRATLIFEAPGSFRVSQIANGLARLATGVTAASDGKTSRISFVLAEGIELRHFRADAKIVIDLMHDGRLPDAPPAAGGPSADPSPGPAASARPWESQPLSRAAAAREPSWIDAPKALAPPAPAPPSRPSAPPRAMEPRPGAVSGPAAIPPTGPVPAVPATLQTGAAPVDLAPAPASGPPTPESARTARVTPAVPPWRQTVREAACRGDLERAAAILTERMAASPLDPIDWYNLTWLLRTLAGATMAPPPKPVESVAYDAPLVGLCSGRPVAGTVATWQRLTHAGQFTEFLVDAAPSAVDAGRR